MLIRRLSKNPLIREGAPLLGLYWLYSSIRWFIARDSPYEAFHNAFRIIDLERQLGIFHELAIQNWLIDHQLGFVHVANAFYTFGYFPVVIAWVVMLYRFAPRFYQVFKLTFLLGLGFSLISFSVFPLAPPRMLPGVGFVDTQQAFSAGIYNDKFILSFYNPYAAMPSLHFGLAFLVGIIAYRFNRRILKIAAVLYPSFMALVILTTGHHYILDIAGGATVMGMAYGLVKALPWIVKEAPASPVTLNRIVSYSQKHPRTEVSLRSNNLAFLGYSRKERELFREQELRSTMLASLVSWRPPF